VKLWIENQLKDQVQKSDAIINFSAPKGFISKSAQTVVVALS